LTKELNFINITVVPTIDCLEAYGDFIDSSILCCVAPKGKATCQASSLIFKVKVVKIKILQGDSGGPLVMREADKKFTQIGIVSFGPVVCGEGPLGFTRVTSHLGWISEVAGISVRKSQ